MEFSGVALIDCRAPSVFALGHCVGSANFDGIHELAQMIHALPETSTPLVLIGEAEQLPSVRDFLSEKGYLIQATHIWCDDFVARLKQHDLWEVGQSIAPLWRPSPLVHDFVHALMPQLKTPGLIGLDVACGSGRDLVYLAKHGWQMTGYDLRAEILEKAQALAHRCGVSVITQQRDLETGVDPFADYEAASVHLICVARYLHRPLFPYLKRLLAPGGMIVYQTFMQGCERFGSPKNPKFLLAPNELSQVFHGYHILTDDMITLPDGRPMSAFIAQKPLESAEAVIVAQQSFLGS
jgi:SAM-dependent methyltransferase